MDQLEATGSVSVNDLKQRAAPANLAWRTIERAKGRLGVRARREGGKVGGHWRWVAPSLNSAKTERSAAFSGSEGVGTRNSSGGTDFDGPLKTADAEGRQTTMAADETEADALEEVL